MGKIFRGEHRRSYPHDRRDHGVDRPETGDAQGETAAGKDPGNHQELPCGAHFSGGPFSGEEDACFGIKRAGTRGARQHKRQSQNCSRQEKSRILSGFLIPFPYCSCRCGPYKGPKDYNRNQHPVPPVFLSVNTLFRIPSSVDIPLKKGFKRGLCLVNLLCTKGFPLRSL